MYTFTVKDFMVSTVSMLVNKGLHDEIIVPTIISASETWVWNKRIQLLEINDLRIAGKY